MASLALSDISRTTASALPTSGARVDLAEAQRSFMSVLGKHMPETRQLSPAERARETAEQFVTISLVQPLLKQLRATSNAAPPFAPTEAEKQFRSLTDADLAQKIVKAKHFPIVDRVAQVLLERGGKLTSGRSIEEELAAAHAPVPQNRPTGVNARAR